MEQRSQELQLASLHTDAEVKSFARHIGIAPGIVVGRLQKEELWPSNRGNNLKRKLQLVEDWARNGRDERHCLRP
jgi:HTH-type transcriptional regulator/antitoxin HigA